MADLKRQDSIKQKERSAGAGGHTPEQDLRAALDDLAYHTMIQKMGVAEIAPVDDAMQRMNDAIVEIKAAGREVPHIDLTGLPSVFIMHMERFPELRPVAKWWEEMDRKERLKKDLVERKKRGPLKRKLPR